MFFCPALELFHCLPPLFCCLPLWTTVRLHGKKLQNATNQDTYLLSSSHFLFTFCFCTRNVLGNVLLTMKNYGNPFLSAYLFTIIIKGGGGRISSPHRPVPTKSHDIPAPLTYLHVSPISDKQATAACKILDHIFCL